MRRKAFPPQTPETASEGDTPTRKVKLLALGAGFGAAALVAAWLPATTFITRSIVEIGTPDPAMRLALAQASREAVLARPVLSRAAASLATAHVPVPDPAILEQIAVMTGLAGSHATGRDARLANALLSTVTAGPGQFPGTIDIVATDPVPEIAARTADAVAEALVGDDDDRGAAARRDREVEADTRIAAAKATADRARARFAMLGGSAVDPVQARVAAAAATATAQARVDVIKAILASGSPPISERRDVPDPIATAQRTYLDLSTQLAKAHETLGDRHTTIITLREGVARAATEVTAAWKRLDRAARVDLDAARTREADLRKASAPSDPSKRGELETARQSLQSADQAVAVAEAERRDPGEATRTYRLIARAPIPASPGGFSAMVRGLAALLVGLATLAFVLAVSAWRRAAPSVVTDLAEATPKVAPARSSFFDSDASPLFQKAAEKKDDQGAEDRRFDARPSRPAASRAPARPIPAEPRRPIRLVADEPARSGMREVFREMLERIETIDPVHGVPTLMVGANDAGAGTDVVALELATAATAAGRRVLVVEAESVRPSLAGAAVLDAEPMLADIFGMLRVVLDAEAGDGLLTIAPCFDNSGRLAATLARQGETPIIDDIAAAFDLVIVDGRADAGLVPADLYLRVGRFTSRRDDERFLATADATAESFVGTLVGGVFVPWSKATPFVPREVPFEERPSTVRPASQRYQAERRRAASR